MKYKIIILLLITFILTGCTSYTELNKLSIVNTLGIDYIDNQYQLSINVIEGELDDRKVEKELTTYTTKNKDLTAAFQDIYLMSNKRLYLSHIDLLVLSKTAINDKLTEITKHFLTNNEYRNNFYVTILKDNTIEKFLTEKILADDINDLINANESETAISYTKDLEGIIKELLIDKNSYLPTISYKDKQLTLEGFTLIKNYRVFDQLSLNESILVNMLNNHLNKTYFEKYHIYNNQTIIKTNKNKITFNLTATITGEEKDYEKDMKKSILDLLKKYQDKDYDLLKLTERVRKNDYKYYKKERDLLSKLEFKVNIDTKQKENYLKGGLENE